MKVYQEATYDLPIPNASPGRPSAAPLDLCAVPQLLHVFWVRIPGLGMVGC